MNSTANVPFEQLPYQCFQEARRVLAEDRTEKIRLIETQRARIARLVTQDPAVSGGEANKQRRLDSMRKELERLKIVADINDPMVKKRFEDGDGMPTSF
jgi:large subunit ribosomal protein L35